ncbi:MAG: serine/threonine protein phosphatase [Saprospiraceae bacterium]|nr:serine/threonine protein phosphatase [Saprospiraceae bacterium]
MRKIAISDIHGCSRSFRALLQQVQLQKTDQLYLLGDYINKGPDSKGVIDLIWQLQNEGHQINCLRGNHEQMFINAYDSPDFNDLAFPEFLQSFGIEYEHQAPPAYADWALQLPLYLEVDQYILVHAGLEFSVENPLTDKNGMLWKRYWYNDIDYQWLGDRIILHGHTPITQEELLRQQKRLPQVQAMCLDTGCAHKQPGMGYLSAFDITNNQLYFQAFID